MKQTTAQNAYFDALKTILNTGTNNHNIDRLLDEMLTEYSHNVVGEEYDTKKELLWLIEKRFNSLQIPDNRLCRNIVNSFRKNLKFQEPIPPHLDINEIIKNSNKEKKEETIPNKEKIENINSNAKIKLKWIGSKTQMYFAIRKLKEMKLLISSYEDIGLFLIQNIDKFNDADLGTVINEIQKKKYDKIPNDKRVDLTGLNEVIED